MVYGFGLGVLCFFGRGVEVKHGHWGRNGERAGIEGTDGGIVIGRVKWWTGLAMFRYGVGFVVRWVFGGGGGVWFKIGGEVGKGGMVRE